jgi:hypothetical protein
VIFLAVCGVFALFSHSISFVLYASLIVSYIFFPKLNASSLSFTENFLLFFYVLLIFYLHKSFGGDIHFGSVDPAGHFDMCRTYANNEVVLLYKQSRIMAYKEYPISYYANCGLILWFFGFESFQHAYLMFAAFNVFLIFILFNVVSSYLKNFGTGLFFYYVAFLLITGFLLDLYFEGFYSQILGLLLMFAYLSLSINNSRTGDFFVRTLLLAGIFLSYHYYLMQLLLFELSMLIVNRKNKDQMFLLFFSGFCAFLLVLPSLIPFLRASKVIAQNGSIYKDLILNFTLVFPGFLFLWNKSKIEIDTLARSFLIAALCFSGVLLVLVSYGICSPYYFYKNYPLLWIALAAGFLRWVNIGLFEPRWVAVSLVGIVCYGFNPYFKKILDADNNFVQVSNFHFIKSKPQLSAGEIDLLNNFARLNPDKKSSCLVGKDDKMLIWFTEITNGIFFRGEYDGNDAWSKFAWTQLQVDHECNLPNAYTYIVDFTCQKGYNVIIKNANGCVYKI